MFGFHFQPLFLRCALSVLVTCLCCYFYSSMAISCWLAFLFLSLMPQRKLFIFGPLIQRARDKQILESDIILRHKSDWSNKLRGILFVHPKTLDTPTPPFYFFSLHQSFNSFHLQFFFLSYLFGCPKVSTYPVVQKTFLIN